MLISVQPYNFIFVRIPKVASSSIRNALRFYSDGRPRKIRTTLKDIKRTKAYHRCEKFAFVRNPYDRLVSYYFYHEDVYKRRGKSAKWKNFEEFISMKYDQNYWQFKQLNWITDDNGKMLCDYIGYFEDLNSEFKAVCDVFELRPQQLNFINRGKKRNGRLYQQFYNTKTFDMVTDICKDDLETLGYDFDGIVKKNDLNNKFVRRKKVPRHNLSRLEVQMRAFDALIKSMENCLKATERIMNG